MTNKIQVNLRLTEDVISKLKAEAENQKRSVNNLLEVIIDKYLKELENN
ncbi:MAG: Arc family DNA-binding protein [Clostridia bacterium]|nr:Arc family DNA-binding protein [Clostridia bacterium]